MMQNERPDFNQEQEINKTKSFPSGTYVGFPDDFGAPDPHAQIITEITPSEWSNRNSHHDTISYIEHEHKLGHLSEKDYGHISSLSDGSWDHKNGPYGFTSGGRYYNEHSEAISKRHYAVKQNNSPVNYTSGISQQYQSHYPAVISSAQQPSDPQCTTGNWQCCKGGKYEWEQDQTHTETSPNKIPSNRSLSYNLSPLTQSITVLRNGENYGEYGESCKGGKYEWEQDQTHTETSPNIIPSNRSLSCNLSPLTQSNVLRNGENNGEYGESCEGGKYEWGQTSKRQVEPSPNKRHRNNSLSYTKSPQTQSNVLRNGDNYGERGESCKWENYEWGQTSKRQVEPSPYKRPRNNSLSYTKSPQAQSNVLGNGENYGEYGGSYEGGKYEWKQDQTHTETSANKIPSNRSLSYNLSPLTQSITVVKNGENYGEHGESCEGGKYEWGQKRQAAPSSKKRPLIHPSSQTDFNSTKKISHLTEKGTVKIKTENLNKSRLTKSLTAGKNGGLTKKARPPWKIYEVTPTSLIKSTRWIWQHFSTPPPKRILSKTYKKIPLNTDIKLCDPRINSSELPDYEELLHIQINTPLSWNE